MQRAARPSSACTLSVDDARRGNASRSRSRSTDRKILMSGPCDCRVPSTPARQRLSTTGERRREGGDHGQTGHGEQAVDGILFTDRVDGISFPVHPLVMEASPRQVPRRPLLHGPVVKQQKRAWRPRHHAHAPPPPQNHNHRGGYHKTCQEWSRYRLVRGSPLIDLQVWCGPLYDLIT